MPLIIEKSYESVKSSLLYIKKIIEISTKRYAYLAHCTLIYSVAELGIY